LEGLRQQENSYANLTRPHLGDDVPMAREVQANLFIVPKNKYKWTGLELLKESQDRSKQAKGTPVIN